MPLKIVSRKEWGAKPPKFVSKMGKAADFVIIHHSESPPCETIEKCINSMRSIQDFHQRTRGWSDIGYK